jgi:hypothetical protein
VEELAGCPNSLLLFAWCEKELQVGLVLATESPDRSAQPVSFCPGRCSPSWYLAGLALEEILMLLSKALRFCDLP